MTYKLIGGLLIICSSYLFSINKCIEIKNQLVILQQFKNDVMRLKNAIELSKKPICDLLNEKLNENNDQLNTLYIKFHELCESNDVVCAWNQSVNSIKLNLKIKKIFLQFSDLFSMMDINGQKELFESYIKTLEFEISELKEYINKNDKLFKNLGLYAGILLTILLS